MDTTQAAIKIQSKVRQIQASTKFKKILKILKIVPTNVIRNMAIFGDADTMFNVKIACKELNEEISSSMIYHARIIEERQAGQTDLGRFDLASNPNLHAMPDIATILASDEHPWIRSALARNPSLHLLPNADTLVTALAGDTERRVRLALASNPRPV
jgi:hypothetical protein